MRTEAETGVMRPTRLETPGVSSKPEAAKGKERTQPESQRSADGGFGLLVSRSVRES